MRLFSHRPLRMILPLVAFALVLSVGFWTGCSQDDGGTLTAPDLKGRVFAPSVEDPAIQAVMQVQDRHTPELFEFDGVVGTATGLSTRGAPVIKVYLERNLPRGLVPASIEGVPVETEVTGRFVAMKKPSASSGHTAIQTPPIQLGTSGGWEGDLANGYCCAGTLGSLITKNGKKYVLSNYHVFEADIVPGGNGIVATTGDPIIQPGLIDVGCYASQAQQVATLEVTHSLPNNNVDCSIAEIIPGMVDPSGAILEIGTLSASTVAAYIGQPVKKSGRTTGLTRSTVSGLNATVSVSYENECAGETVFTVTFTGQIMINNKRSAFLAGGDSGSLMVEDVTTSPCAVGLLFAGGNKYAVANPIDEVLGFLGATMVGD